MLPPAQTEALPGLDPAYLAAKEKLTAGKISRKPIPQRKYGRTKTKLSIIGFGGMVVKDVRPKEAANFVAEAVDRGVNYFDVAPFYGNAEERLGPALQPTVRSVSSPARPWNEMPPVRRRNSSGH